MNYLLTSLFDTMKKIFEITVLDKEGCEHIKYNFDTEEKADLRFEELRDKGLSAWQLRCSYSIINQPFDESHIKHL
jgi:hypothetical protein